MSSPSFRLCMGLALPLGEAQAWLAGQFRTIAREDPLWVSWLTGLAVFLAWLPTRLLFIAAFWLAMQTPEGRRHQAGERRSGRG